MKDSIIKGIIITAVGGIIAACFMYYFVEKKTPPNAEIKPSTNKIVEEFLTEGSGQEKVTDSFPEKVKPTLDNVGLTVSYGKHYKEEFSKDNKILTLTSHRQDKSFVCYNVGRNYSFFDFTLAKVKTYWSCELIIIGDGKILEKTGYDTYNKIANERFTIPIKGVNEVRIELINGSRSYEDSECVIVNTRAY